MGETFSVPMKRDRPSLTCCALHWLKLQPELSGKCLTTRTVNVYLFFLLPFAYKSAQIKLKVEKVRGHYFLLVEQLMFSFLQIATCYSLQHQVLYTSHC